MNETNETKNEMNVLIFFLFLSDEGPSLETLDFAFNIDSTPTFLYFDLYFTLPTQQTTFITFFNTF